MLLRICTTSVLVFLALNQSANAQVSQQLRAAMHMSDPRSEFVRQCAPHMLGRWAHPEEVCGCLHDHAAGVVEDRDLRIALLRGISETGVPTIENDWVPASKQAEIGPTFTRIAKPTLQCMFDPAK
jgi:glycine/D-amino acid oxidase-like deaminating enzyme